MKTFKKIFMLVLMMLFVVSLASCKKCNKNKVCTEHTDANQDLVCDVCQEKLTCSEHVDTNTDYKCDLCGEALKAPEKFAKIAIETSADKIKKGEEITITVTVTEVDDKSYTLKVSDETLVKLDGNKLTVIGDITLDKTVT